MEFYTVRPEEALEALGTDPARGLKQSECQRRLLKYGKNELRTEKRRSLFLRFLSQFQDFMVLILLAAAGISFGVSWIRGDGEYVDSLIILAIVVCNAVIGTVQELRADRAIEALKKMSSPTPGCCGTASASEWKAGSWFPGTWSFSRQGIWSPQICGC